MKRNFRIFNKLTVNHRNARGASSSIWAAWNKFRVVKSWIGVFLLTKSYYAVFASERFLPVMLPHVIRARNLCTEMLEGRIDGRRKRGKLDGRRILTDWSNRTVWSVHAWPAETGRNGERWCMKWSPTLSNQDGSERGGECQGGRRANSAAPWSCWGWSGKSRRSACLQRSTRMLLLSLPVQCNTSCYRDYRRTSVV